MKGIILAGGSGTRLHPLTIAQSKQLLPIFDKPLIYYPLSTLISFGIKEILIITNPENINSFKNLLGNGDDFGIKIEYLSQSRPNGIAEALIIGEDFIDNDSTSLILGDNIFISDSLHFNASNHFKGDGAMIFSIEVNDPQRYGVVKFNREDPELIVEKPDKFISNHAVTGLYFYDSNASNMAKSLELSSRGELEITDLNNLYLGKKQLEVFRLSSSSSWMDAGTFNSLQDASEFIAALQKRSGQLFGSPEYAAYKQGFIDKNIILKKLDSSPKNEYYLMLEKLALGN